MRIHLRLKQLQFCQVLRILLLAHIFQKPLNSSRHLSGTCIQFLNLDIIGWYGINCLIFPLSYLLNIIKNLGNRLGNTISQPERTPQQNTSRNKNYCTHRQKRQPDISRKL